MTEVFDIYGSGFDDDDQNKPLSVLQAKRIHTGKISVLGTIVSVSEMYVLEVKEASDPTRTELRDAKSIQLEDTETLDEIERLDVILFDDMVNNVRAGEVVVISGNMQIENKKGNERSKKKTNILHAISINYVNRKEVTITKRDIETFHKFANHDDSLIERVVSMIAPDVIGHDDVKLGLLRSIVGGVDRGRKGSGRIDTLLVGDPGTAKSSLAKGATDIKPNSRFVSAPHASTKTITAIVEKENESFMLRLGALPLSGGAICGINEITSFTLEDQSRLLDILQEGQFPVDKHGRHYDVPSPTTIIATANPIQVKWTDSQIISNDEIELKKNLMDRFTQVYGFRDNMTPEQTSKFVKQMDNIRQRRPHNYNFLRKYMIYAGRVNVKITKEAQNMLNEFWVSAKNQGLLSIRMYFGLYKIAEAQAKLRLKDEVDEEIAKETMEDVRVMMAQYGPTVGMVMGPRETTYKTFLEIVQYTPAGITIEELCNIACKENRQISDYLGNRWSVEQNHKLRPIIEMLLNHQNIKRIHLRPITLKWVTDYEPPDLADPADVKLDNSLPQPQLKQQECDKHEKMSVTSVKSDLYPNYRKGA